MLFDELKLVDSNLCNITNNKFTETLVNGSSLFNINQNIQQSKKCIRKDSLSTYCIIKGNHETMTVDLKRFTL